ncbi:MAG: FprA family A-type flavoprotein [bacterium]|nr:FprA family A-type flavoprotein [bacterium]
MKSRLIKDGIYFLGAVDWDRRLFDALIPLPDGTSYNAYLIKGSEKIVLLDTVDPTMTNILLAQLKDIENIDYVVCHHVEQDHSGALPVVLEKYGSAKVIISTRGKDMLIDHLHIPEDRIITVEDGETFSLGDKTLKFIYTPWVHWPETMSTYLVEDKILFTCDFFGSHLATNELYAEDKSKVYEAAKRYYAEIMMPFRTNIQKNLEKLRDLDISIIAPSHGPIHNDPNFIIEAYKDWASDTPKNIVIIPYISMHNSTRIMVDYLISSLTERDIKVERFDLSSVDLGKLAISLVDAGTVIVGTPTVLVGPHPNVVYAVYLFNALRPKTRYISVVGSYGWGGKTIDILKGMLTNVKVELLEPVLVKGLPREKDLKALDKLADLVAEKHREFSK